MDRVTDEQALALMEIDLDIDEVIRQMDEDADLSEADRGLVINYLRWAWINGYAQCYNALDVAARRLVKNPASWTLDK